MRGDNGFVKSSSMISFARASVKSSTLEAEGKVSRRAGIKIWRKLFRGFLDICCWTAATCVLFLSVIHAERLPIKTYTVADGLLRDSVQKIKQDSRGFLWFCTAEGVSRFDGESFTNFTTD